MIEIRLLDAQAAGCERANLAETLADCVAGGASVGFMWPFSAKEAHAWWGEVIEDVAQGKVQLFGGYVGGTLSGTVQLEPCLKPNQRHRGDVKKLLVHRRARGRGLAGRLMAALEQEAQGRGLSLLTLDTITGSDAERLYGKLGWTKAGVIPNYALMPDGPPSPTSIFWKTVG